jgi:sec-independent protein translocase protein TatB
MIDFGFDKIALIGAVALIVIGPEKLPRVARTVGHLVGKAQRYVADVKAEVNRSIELEELQKMKSQFEDAARNVHVEQSVRTRGQRGVQRRLSTPKWDAASQAIGEHQRRHRPVMVRPAGQRRRRATQHPKQELAPEARCHAAPGTSSATVCARGPCSIRSAARVARFRPPREGGGA